VQLLGADVFEAVRSRLVDQSDASTFMRAVGRAGERLREVTGGPSLLVFFDEAQLLSGLCMDRFQSKTPRHGEAPELTRDLFSAVTKALVSCRSASAGHLSHATLSGTGFSMQGLGGQVSSAMAKPGEVHKTFTEFEWAETVDRSMRFVELLADVAELDDDLVAHVAGWLIGRARWSAALAQTWLEIAAKVDATSSFIAPSDLLFPFIGTAPTGPSLVMHHALGLFVEEMTKSRPVFRRGSTSSQTGGGVVAQLMSDHSERRDLLLPVLSHAALLFSCSGALVKMAKLSPNFDTVALVELGVCCLRRRDKDDDAPKDLVALAEPLIVEAVMRALPWADLTDRRMGDQVNASARGAAFESCATPVIDAIFSRQIAVDAHEFASVPHGLEGGWRRGRSACGVLVRACVEVADLAEWARASQAARFDGQVAPMATPSTGFGADLLVLVRKCKDLSIVRWAFVQLKMAKDAKVASALRTVDPELLLHMRRDKATPTPLGDFEKVYMAFFGVQPGAKGGAPRAPAFRVLINFQTTEPGSKRRSGTKRPPQAVADVVKKCKTDAMIYLDRDDVVAAVTEQLGDEDAVAYINVMSATST
jgi:hypothetical protein